MSSNLDTLPHIPHSAFWLSHSKQIKKPHLKSYPWLAECPQRQHFVLENSASMVPWIHSFAYIHSNLWKRHGAIETPSVSRQVPNFLNPAFFSPLLPKQKYDQSCRRWWRWLHWRNLLCDYGSNGLSFWRSHTIIGPWKQWHCYLGNEPSFSTGRIWRFFLLNN